MQPIITYLIDQVLPDNKEEAYKLKRRSAYFALPYDILHKRGFLSPLLRYIGGEEATYILHEVHESVCGNYSRGLALARKVLRQWYY